MKQVLQTPVLLIAFNRPGLVLQSLQLLQQVQPKRLYIALDGPRNGNATDAQKIKEIKIAIAFIPWKCRVQILEQKKNMGCGRGPVKAMDWFFSHEKEGIILEDDIQPDTSFFFFCEELLQRYRNNKQIAAISGSNYLPPALRKKESYYFSRFTHTWGWATWRRVWKQYDFHISDWELSKKAIFERFSSFFDRWYWYMKFESIHKKRFGSVWDYQWTYLCLKHHMCSIIPRQNLVSNIGVGTEATHTQTIHARLQANIIPMHFPLTHPKAIVISTEADRFIQLQNYVFWKGLVVYIAQFFGFMR